MSKATQIRSKLRYPHAMIKNSIGLPLGKYKTRSRDSVKDIPPRNR